MKNRFVRELTVPLSEYATVNENATLFEAVLALEKAQEECKKTHHPYRAMLVLNSEGNIVGKIYQIDVMRALEPIYDELQGKKGLTDLGFTKKFIQAMVSTHNLWNKPINDICKMGADRKVKDFMHIPADSEFVDEDETLDIAIHQIVTGKLQSLQVTRQGKTIGILRLVDAYSCLVDMLKKCKL